MGGHEIGDVDRLISSFLTSAPDAVLTHQPIHRRAVVYPDDPSSPWAGRVLSMMVDWSESAEIPNIPRNRPPRLMLAVCVRRESSAVPSRHLRQSLTRSAAPNVIRLRG